MKITTIIVLLTQTSPVLVTGLGTEKINTLSVERLAYPNANFGLKRKTGRRVRDRERQRQRRRARAHATCLNGCVFPLGDRS